MLPKNTCSECGVVDGHNKDCAIWKQTEAQTTDNKGLQGKQQVKERLPILVEREKKYGNFSALSMRKKKLMEVLTFPDKVKLEFSPVEAEALNQIATKLARITYNPKHKDSWRDIIGYCTLVLEELEF